MPESQVFTHANFSGYMYLTGMEKPVPGSQIVGMARAKKKKRCTESGEKEKGAGDPLTFLPLFFRMLSSHYLEPWNRLELFCNGPAVI